MRRRRRRAATQAINSYKHRGSFKHLNKSVEQALVIVVSCFKIFFEDCLGVAYGLNCQFLIVHYCRFA
jgi:hypothetical protein